MGEGSMYNKELLKLKLELENELRTSMSSEESSKKWEVLCDKAKKKEILSIDEQIDYVRYKGISISDDEEDDARDILTNRTYYFKVTAYRKNFEKDISGKYVNTSFLQLANLAQIDMYLRMILGRMISELEHSIKTLLIQSITNSPNEDGYTIVSEFDE